MKNLAFLCGVLGLSVLSKLNLSDKRLLQG